MNAKPGEPSSDGGTARGQGETILVLEDDRQALAFTVKALDQLGYRVLKAGDIEAARKLLDKNEGRVDLLLADIVLAGGGSGPEFATEVLTGFADLKVVFMSGYADGLYTDGRVPGFESPLLKKPFSLAELAHTLRDALAD